MSALQNAIPAQYPVLQVPTAIDYTSKDWTSLVQSMLTYAGTAFPDWNTSSEGDFGVMMVELFAYMGDILSYYGDRISQEAYLPTATQRQSLLNISQTLGYIPANGSPASGTVTFATDTIGPPVTVPQGTQVASSFAAGTTGAPAIFETQAQVVVPGDGGSASVLVLQGVTESLISIGVSDGTPGQALVLPQLGVIDGTVQIFVEGTGDAPVQWTQVDYLIDSGAEDTVFQSVTDQAGATTIVFGDGVNGLIPPLAMAISATYRIGIGSAGNLPAGAVAIIVDAIDGVSIPLLEDNVTPDSSAMLGGSDPETNDQIRANAPASYRAQYRAVSTEDFADLVLNVPGVLMSTAVANHNTSVSLYVLGPNYGQPGPALIDSILTYFEGKTVAGVTVSVVDPSIILIDIGSSGNPVQVFVQPTYSQAVVQANITASLQAFLSPPNVGFGQLINVSDIYNVIIPVPGVQYAIVPVFTREDVRQAGNASIQLRPTEVPSAGNFFFSMSGGLN